MGIPGSEWRRYIWTKHSKAILAHFRGKKSLFSHPIYSQTQCGGILVLYDVLTTLRHITDDSTKTIGDVLDKWARQYMNPLFACEGLIPVIVFDDYAKCPKAKRATQARRDSSRQPEVEIPEDLVARTDQPATYWEPFFRLREKNQTLQRLCVQKLLSVAALHGKACYIAAPALSDAMGVYSGNLVHYRPDPHGYLRTEVVTIGELKYGEGDMRIVECMHWLQNLRLDVVVKTVDHDLFPILLLNYPDICGPRNRVFLHLSPLSQTSNKKDPGYQVQEYVIDISFFFKTILQGSLDNASAFTLALTFYGTDFTSPLKGCASNTYLIQMFFSDLECGRINYHDGHPRRYENAIEFVERVKKIRSRQTACLDGSDLQHLVLNCFNVVRYWSRESVENFSHH